MYKIVAGHLGYYKKHSRVRPRPGTGWRTAPGLPSIETVRHAWLLNVNTQLSLLVKPRKSAKCTNRADVAPEILSGEKERSFRRPRDSPFGLEQRLAVRIIELILHVALLLLGVNVVRAFQKM